MLSAVVPVFNEEESLPEFTKRLDTELGKIDKSFEIIFIDDGSTDKTLELLKNFSKKDKNIRVFSFRKNQGKAEALTLGFQRAKGDMVITLDADLQDRPEEIKKLVVRLNEGWEVVCGWRKDRSDTIKKRISSKLFNFLMGAFWGVKLHDYNGGLKLYNKDAAKSLHLYGGMHRFIPLLATQYGFSVTEEPIIHDKRKFGESKYGFSKIFKDIPDMFTMLFLTRYGKRPLHFFATAGGILFIIGFGIFLYLWIGLQILQHLSIGRRPLFFVSLVMMLAGLQVFFTGFLADIMINIAHSPQLSEEGIHNYLRFDSDKV